MHSVYSTHWNCLKIQVCLMWCKGLELSFSHCYAHRIFILWYFIMKHSINYYFINQSNCPKKKKKSHLAWPQLVPIHISLHYCMVYDSIFMTTTGSHVIFLVCHYVFPGECPSSSLFVLAESEWGPMGACAWGPFTVPVPPLATVPKGGGDAKHKLNQRNKHTHTPPLSHVQTEPFNLLNIYLFIEDIFSLWVQPFCSHSLCPALLYALHVRYTALYTVSLSRM